MDLPTTIWEFCGGISCVSVITSALIVNACALRCICANDKYPSPPTHIQCTPPQDIVSVSQT